MLVYNKCMRPIAMLEPVLAFAVLLVNHALGAELFLNPGMEQPDMVGTWGNAWGYKVDRINTDSHSGNYSAKLYQRTQSYQGIGQDVALTTNTRYAIEGYVKLLNNNSKMSQEFEFMIRYQWSNDFSNSSWIQIGFHRFAHPKDGWIRVAADFTTPLRQWHLANVYIQGPDVGIDYLADDFSLKEVPENSTWRQASLESIERIRKSNITLSVNVGAQYDPHFIEVEVALRSHEFGFGSVIDDAAYLDPGYVTYQNLLHEFFNWATVGTYKWGYNQGTPTHPNYDRAVNATNALLKNGMIVRGHNMFWGTTGDTPDWAQKLSSDQLKATIDERIRFMTNITYGKLAHWDVNNEMLHGQVYEEITRDPNYSQHIYRAVHAADPSVKLFLNEYNVLANGDSTEDFVRQALSFKAANCGLYGLGLQSHFAEYVAPDPTLILRRLKRLASTGLPLWITELSLANKNENVTADWFEQVLTIYFAHPAVEGVILWGFWDRMGVNSNGALVNGNNYHINAAGKRYLDLVKKRWSTNIKSPLTQKLTSLDIRGFHGDYDVIIRYRGKPIKKMSFKLPSDIDHVTWAVDVDGNGDEIVLPTHAPTSEPVKHVHHVIHDHTRTLGHVTSSSGTDQWTCTTRYSELSAIGDDKTTDISCISGEIMTGCSSRTMDGSSVRDGEYFQFSNGAATCRAVNAFQSAAPVQAVARCCSRRSLQCTYMTAGPSLPGKEEQIAVTCPGHSFPVGCTSYTYFGFMDGAYSNGTDCVAQGDGARLDYTVFVYAACCQAPSMTCHVRRSAPSGLKRGDRASVTCSAGETLVGCSVYSEDGSTGGAMPDSTGRGCTAFNGQERFPGEDSVNAIAVCCT